MTLASLRRIAATRIAQGVPTVVVEIVASRGSVPRDAGTRMLVGAEEFVGTIGGGNLEWRALAKAREMLADPRVRHGDDEVALGASLGQCCGGAVTLRYRMLDAAALAGWSASTAVPNFQVYGAGHVGRAVVRVLELLDVYVEWIDERESAFPIGASSANVNRVCVEPVEAEVRTASPNTFYLVLTHQHDIDLSVVEAILRRGDFAFLGLIGSTTKRRRFAQLLRQRGIDDALIARMVCPIGAAGIGGKEPAHIAISVAAQLLPLISQAQAALAELREAHDA